MKTGLEVWAELHNTTADEIKILLTAEGHDPTQFLNGSAATEEAIPSGKDEALAMLLARGRNGEIRVAASIIEDITGMKLEIDTVGSDTLPEMFGISSAEKSIESTKQEEVPEQVEPEKKPDVRLEAEKKPARKKTKYSVNKAMAEEILKFKADALAVRTIRMFFLSLPEYKAADVAVMSDEEVQTEFAKNYACITVESGTFILPKQNCELIRDVLISNDNYFVPTN